MATNNTSQGQQIFQIKVTLSGSKPVIWRRLLAPSTWTLAQLHDALQSVMEWEDYHLHEFHVRRLRIGIPDPDIPTGDPDVADDRKVGITEVFPKVGAKAKYLYDFGDDWEHTLTLEKILEPDSNVTYPICIGGKLNAPPEDCGGIYGYYDYLKALGDKKHPNHRMMMEWRGGKYDEEFFSLDLINQRLAVKFRPRRKAVGRSRPGT